MNKWETTILVCAELGIVILSFIAGIIGSNVYAMMQERNNLFSKSDGSGLCNNLNLTGTALCLKEDLKQFYSYNISNLNKDLNETELKEQGGVCWHYADWYANKMKDFGFGYKEIDIWGNETRGHEFTVAFDSNLTSYCVLDQLNVNCVELG